MRALSLALILAVCCASADPLQIFVGGYSAQIQTLNLDPDSATLKLQATQTNCGIMPSWVTVSHSKKNLYSSDDSYANGNGGAFAFNINADGSLTHIDDTSTNGAGSLMCSASPNNKILAVANYFGASMSTIKINASDNGLVQSVYQQFVFHGHGPNPNRQDKPYPHAASFDPTGQYLFVPDLGTDTLHRFRVDQDTGFLTQLSNVSTGGNTGPRHIVFLVTDSTTYLYNIREINSSIQSYIIDYENDGALKEVQTISTLPPNAECCHKAAEMAISPDQRFLYASNRRVDPTNDDSDTFAIYSLDPTNGMLKVIGFSETGGQEPRHFSIDMSGRWLVVANQNSNRVTVQERDLETGSLTIRSHYDYKQPSVTMWNQ